MNFKRILVAINHSPLTSTVFERSLHLAQREQAHLMILTCIADVAEPNQGIGSDGMMYGHERYPINTRFSKAYTEAIQSENQKAESWLQQYCQSAAALNVPVGHQHHFTDPGTTICRAAEEWNADLIVLGRHDRAAMSHAPLEAIAEFFTGSVSNHVIHHADCSVLTIKDDSTKHIGVPHRELAPHQVVPTQ